MDLCSKQTEEEAAELADALKQMSRKVKLLSVWKPQVPMWASCHTAALFPWCVFTSWQLVSEWQKARESFLLLWREMHLLFVLSVLF